jgi:hypothetical protein
VTFRLYHLEACCLFAQEFMNREMSKHQHIMEHEQRQLEQVNGAGFCSQMDINSNQKCQQA